ncbi:MAG: protein phosphatase 2C domain-containing protein [Desulfobacterales bacterium]
MATALPEDDITGKWIMVAIEAAGISDVGRRRKKNEDSFLVDHRQKLYIVADGMGGHKAGDVASQLTVDIIKRHMDENSDGMGHGATDLSRAPSAESNPVVTGIQLANQGIYQSSQKDKRYSGMGSTVSVVHFSGDFLTAANVGDSPIYLIHKGAIATAYEPHTVMDERQVIDPDGTEDIEEKYRHMLTRAVGTRKAVVPAVRVMKCSRGDRLVICSDGLSNKVSQEEIGDIAGKYQPDNACQFLVDLANERGGSDNITVIALKVASVNSG